MKNDTGTDPSVLKPRSVKNFCGIVIWRLDEILTFFDSMDALPFNGIVAVAIRVCLLPILCLFIL